MFITALLVDFGVINIKGTTAQSSSMRIISHEIRYIEEQQVSYNSGMKYVTHINSDTMFVVNVTKDSLECEYYKKQLNR